jgi:hypothetical protein
LAGISTGAGTVAVAAGVGDSVAAAGASGAADWAIDKEAVPNSTAPNTDEKITRIHHS